MLEKTPLCDWDKVLAKVQDELGPDHKPLLIAIDGAWGTGKSHLASWLAWQLGIPSIHLDFYLIKDSEPLTWRTDDLALAINTRLGGGFRKPVIVEGILILDALQKISRQPDYLIFIRGDGGNDLGVRLHEYFARMGSESRAQICIDGFE